MDNFEYIEDYFKNSPTELQQQQFEQRITDDNGFAEEVAFYISANSVIKNHSQAETKERFREIYQQQKVISITRPHKYTIWKYLAAASVIGIISVITWFLSVDKNSPQQLADQYILQNFKTLGVTMGSQDSLQKGLGLYNSGNLNTSLNQFENILATDSTNDIAKKYAGIVSLQLKDYDKAIYYFTSLENQAGLYSNPGKFYHAVTLLARNKTGDEDEAKELLKQVAEKSLDGSEDAAKWLKQMQ